MLRTSTTKARVVLPFVAILVSGCLTKEESPGSEVTLAGDTVPPKVSFSTPNDGQMVGGNVSVVIEASDASGIARVELSADGVIVGIDEAAPFQFNWQPSVGGHEISARAIDASAERNTTVTTIQVTRLSDLAISSPSTLASATLGKYYSNTLSAVGGAPPYVWTVVDGSVPDGLTFDGSSAKIDGLPNTAGLSVFTVRAEDSRGNNVTRTFSLEVDEPSTPPGAGLLGTYSAKTALEPLSYVDADLSGITYVPQSNTLFMIQNSGGRIWEVDLSFNLIRTISARGFGDSEDIVYIGNNEFAIVNEASNLFIGTIAPSATAISADQFQRITFDTTTGNNGYEGVAFDFNTQTFWSVKEFGPKKIVTFPRPTSSSNMTIQPEVPFDAEQLPASDLSAVHFDSRTGNLLILSHEGHKLMEVTLDGVVLSELRMADSSQHEGIALDSSFNFLITSEPNRYRQYVQ